MTDKFKALFSKTLESIRAQLPKKTPDGLDAFISQYYAKMPLASYEAMDTKQAAAIATASFEFIRQRTVGVPKIRIFTPNEKEHGYSLPRMVIEILNDDMPFLVDSVTMELARHNVSIRETIHPIITLRRDDKGALLEVSASGVKTAQNTLESLIHLQVSSLPEGLTAEALTRDIERVLSLVRFAVSDWKDIVTKTEDTLAALASNLPHSTPEDTQEVRDFVRWLADKNFIFLGYIEYDFYDAAGKQQLSVVKGSERGIFKSDDLELKPRGLVALPPEVLHFALHPQLVEITKSNRKSLVHRPVQMDYIGIKRLDESGKVIGERRFLGMFASSVYYQSTDHIPIIRKKVARILARSNFNAGSHDGKALKAILEFYPRDELFQISEDDLFEFSMGILYLESRPAVRLFARRDGFERFISCMVFIPRERFSTAVREQIQAMIEKAYNGTVTTFYTQLGDSPLARLQLIVRTTPGQIPAITPQTIEKGIIALTNLWSDSLREVLLTRQDEMQTESLLSVYANAFPKTYTNLYDVSSAAHDIGKIEQALRSGTLSLELFRSRHDKENIIRLKIYNPDTQVPLSDILPMLENMGFRVIDENPFLITPAGKKPVWIRDFQLTPASGDPLDIAAVKTLFEEGLTRVWCGEMENDGFNALVVRAGLAWRSVVMLRALAKYLKQAGFVYSQQAIEQTLSRYPTIAALIVKLFFARFDPAGTRSEAETLTRAIEETLAAVTSLADDRILRRYVELLGCIWRTNFFQTTTEGGVKPYLSFKFDSARVPELPLPRPYAEIFVYSMRVEGIHLRGGKVARGGLRWSDRREDFRTEVLGLMKAQMVKNSVIVPVGSKGGFVVKQPPKDGGRDAQMEEGIACYKTYLCGLLDITDNIVSGKIIAADAVRYDGDDPYLVVAADKGTATFSDIANSVSKTYGFWLGDAFASGGSAGYDHKKMAITARGAWVSVTRHFREMGVDIATQEFTTVGIGDMSGDVFGNGMILSDRIRLIGAFNHLHIFLDPAPNAATSFAERKRLFNLPRSSWKDYDATLISKGGGIYERSAKSIPLSAEIKQVLGVTADALSPDDLIKALLLAPVDLLWNGGIGTYVKAEDESHDAVGDRTNNAVRVNGRELRCKLVGEGGNLGFTQKGRREYALAGGRINTDAIDNSAGVDCSDHEVNIKIALTGAISSGTLDGAKRDALLASMTDEVAGLVLKDNILQTQAITLAEMQGVALLDSHARLMRRLEKQGQLDRAVEYLPSDKMLADLRAAGRGLTRPELAVLLAYSKMTLYKEILESNLPDDPYLSVDLLRYFPKAMQGEFKEAIETHRLRREIIATVATNSVVNRTGISFLQDIAEDTGMPVADVARAYTIARDAFGMRAIWSEIEAITTGISEKTRAGLYAELTEFLEKAAHWFLRNCPQPLDITAVMQQFVPGIEQFVKAGHSLFSPAISKAYHKKLEKFTAAGVPESLAHRIAGLEALSSACDIVRLSADNNLGVTDVAKSYFAIGGTLRLGWLRLSASKLPVDSALSRLAAQSLIADLYAEQRRLTQAVITAVTPLSLGTLAGWFTKHRVEIERYEQFITDIKSTGRIDFAALVVATRNVKSIAAL